MKPFTWTKRKERAALLVAEDELTDVAIAGAVKISVAGLKKWKARPEFAARVAEIVSATRAAVQARGIAEKQNRLAALNDRWGRLQQIIRERGGDPAMATVPGGQTGLLVRELKAMGTGADMTLVEEFHLDAALLKEAREHEKQAAIELGQWTERKDVTSGGQAIAFTIEIDSRARDEAT